MSEAVVAYVPVLHEGYHRFFEAHARGRRLFILGPELYADYRPLAKDIRALPAELAAAAVRGWCISSSVDVLDKEAARDLAATAPLITMPDEDISHRVADRYFTRCPVQYDTVFLRWDKNKTVQLLRPSPAREVREDEALADLIHLAEGAAEQGIDWWRRVGAAMRLTDGSLAVATNNHEPHHLSAYAVGDPRSNFYKGVHLELTTSTHAEARLIAEAAREGRATQGAVIYVTDFPCPPCAKLIAAAGVARVYFRDGYAVLDGQDVLVSAGIELLRVTP